MNKIILLIIILALSVLGCMAWLYVSGCRPYDEQTSYIPEMKFYEKSILGKKFICFNEK